jgi:Ti-type conjugative transfer relaxase TraA
MGVEWGFVTNGAADLAGVDRQVIDAFSERRRQILEHLDATGFSSARAAQIATLQTRPTKQPSEGSIREVWHAKAMAVGFDPARLAHVIDRGRHAPARAGLHVDLERRLLGSSGLTHNQSTFDRRDVIQAIAQSAQRGATATDIEAFADQILASPAIVALGPSPQAVGGTRYSTLELLELEQRLVDQATDRQLSGAGVVAPAWIEHVLSSRPTITAEQVEMVERLCRDGDGVAVVSAPAGTGKTYALGAAHDAWTESGHRVIGTAVAAKAARELERSAGIHSETLTRLTAGLVQRTLRFDHRTVLVVDEAGMAGTRQLAPFLDAAHQAGAKVVLVGDPRQLPAIQAGGLLEGLTRRLDPIELDTNRRQTQPWEHDALRHLRAGDVDTALDTYRRHDRIHTHTNPTELVRAIVDDAFNARSSGAEVLIVALRRSDVDTINQRFRRRLAAAGELHGQPLFVHGAGYQIGDQILCLRNDYQLDVRNGDRGTITAIDHPTGTIRLATPDGARQLSWDYLDAGHIDHGYATTIHKAQGATVDHCYLYANDTLYRQAAYVALSRGRHTNHIHTLGELTVEPDLTHAPTHQRAQPHDLVRNAFHRQTDNGLAIDTPTAPPPTRQPPARSTPDDDLGIGL